MYQLLLIKYELKLPSEATPTSFAIQNQIEAVCTLSKSPLIDRFLVLGSDYDLALQEIAYYRVCHEKSQLIQDYVTFHLYAEIKYAETKCGEAE